MKTCFQDLVAISRKQPLNFFDNNNPPKKMPTATRRPSISFPIPPILLEHAEFSPLAAAFAQNKKSETFLSESEVERLLEAQFKVEEFLEEIEKFSHRAAGLAHEKAVAEYKANPTPETEAEFRRVGDRQNHAQELSRLRTALERGKNDYALRVVYPLVIPILKRALKMVDEVILELERGEDRNHELYRIPRDRAQNRQGSLAEPVPSPIVRDLKKLVAAKRIWLKEAETAIERGLHFLGGDLPSTMLRDFVYFCLRVGPEE